MASAFTPLKQIVAVRKEEWPLTLSLAVYFFLVITIFWVLKPLKKVLFVNHFKDHSMDVFGATWAGSEVEQIAKLLNMVVAFFAVAVFSWLANSLRRERLTYVWSAVMAFGFVLFSVLVRDPSAATIWGFYLFGDFFNTVMVAAFFAFANDAVHPEAAKRTYGVIGLGGVAGGAVGSTALAATIKTIPTPVWLWICVLGLVGVVVAATAAGRSAPPRPEPVKSERVNGGIVDALGLVVRSRYLLAIVGLVTLYELISTVLDFQYTATVLHFAATEGLDSDAAFSSVYAITNVTGLVVQLVFTSLVMQRFGVGAALLVLPLAALTGSSAFLALPVFFTAASLSVSDNGFNYSINQSARETLYTVTSPKEKYKAKAVIDMFGQRTAKALGVVVNLVMVSAFSSFAGVRYLSLITIPLLLLWLLLVRYLGREFDAREGKQS